MLDRHGGGCGFKYSLDVPVDHRCHVALLLLLANNVVASALNDPCLSHAIGLMISSGNLRVYMGDTHTATNITECFKTLLACTRVRDSALIDYHPMQWIETITQNGTAIHSNKGFIFLNLIAKQCIPSNRNTLT